MLYCSYPVRACSTWLCMTQFNCSNVGRLNFIPLFDTKIELCNFMQWNFGALQYTRFIALTTGKNASILGLTQILNLVICKGNRTEVSGVHAHACRGAQVKKVRTKLK